MISPAWARLFYWEAPDGSKVRSYTPGHYIYFYNVLAKEDTAAMKEMAKESVLWYTKYNDVKKARTVMPAMLNYELSWDRKPVENCPVFMEKWNNIRYIRNEQTGKKTKVKLPQFKYATADEFFHTLDHSTSALPVVRRASNVWLYIHGPSRAGIDCQPERRPFTSVGGKNVLFSSLGKRLV